MDWDVLRATFWGYASSPARRQGWEVGLCPLYMAPSHCPVRGQHSLHWVSVLPRCFGAPKGIPDFCLEKGGLTISLVCPGALHPQLLLGPQVLLSFRGRNVLEL